jgi:hypothetical protein
MYVELLPQGSTINTDVYCNTLKKLHLFDPEEAMWLA